MAVQKLFKLIMIWQSY